MRRSSASSAGWVSAWNSVEIGPHLVFDLLVVGQLGTAAADAQVARGAPLGGAVLHAFLDDQPRRGDGDLGAVRACHRLILGSADGLRAHRAKRDRAF